MQVNILGADGIVIVTIDCDVSSNDNVLPVDEVSMLYAVCDNYHNY